MSVARPQQISVTLLGDFSVSVDGAAIDAARWKFRHPRLLWQMLCLAPVHCVSRDEAAETRWPQAGAGGAASALLRPRQFLVERLQVRLAALDRLRQR
jgi:DNA-binding SARP family transcriptional activator